MNKNIKRLLLLVFCATGIAAFPIWYYVVQKSDLIYEFDARRDTQDIVNLFRKNHYWLTASVESPIEYALKYRAADRSPLSMGRLNIKVLRDKGMFVGFTAYFKETPTEGKILFIAIDEQMRGRRYAEVLMRYAIKDLIQKGSMLIRLLTRVDNLSAQKLYVRLGFIETFRDETFVWYVYKPNISKP